LDVDGVINIDTNPRNDDLRTVQVIHVMQNKREQSYTVLYSPAILEELDKIIHEFKVELVWLTTWLRDGLILKLVDEIDLLRGGRLLPIPLGRLSGGMPQQWKLNALFNDERNQPAPFAWIDDEYQHFTGKARETIGVECLVLRPYGREGLTVSDLTKVRAFLKTLQTN